MSAENMPITHKVLQSISQSNNTDDIFLIANSKSVDRSKGENEGLGTTFLCRYTQVWRLFALMSHQEHYVVLFNDRRRTTTISLPIAYLYIYIFSWILKIQLLRCFSIWMTLPCCSESKCTSPCTPSWSESPSSRALSVSSMGFAFGTVQVRVSESQFTSQKVGILIAASLVGSCADQMWPCVRGAQAPGKHTLSECSFLLPCLENWLHCFCMAVHLYNWLPHKTVLTMVSWLTHFCCSGTLYRVWHILVAQLMLNDWADG